MATTPLRLSEDLKLKISAAARTVGLDTHTFMVGAIRQAVDMVEEQSRLAEAQTTRADMLENRQGHDAGEVRAYLRARLNAPASAPPGVKRWRD
jgi:uncharacterized protein (DUF1778 family)